MNEKEAEAHFYQLVLGLQSSAWMLLGKVANPTTGKLDKNLEAAKSTIDTLLMLKVKTKGNVSKEEEELLSAAIGQLQLNYVNESEKKDESDKKEESVKKEDIKSEEKKAETEKTEIKSKTKE